jgi:hypothetical protein
MMNIYHKKFKKPHLVSSFESCVSRSAFREKLCDFQRDKKLNLTFPHSMFLLKEFTIMKRPMDLMWLPDQFPSFLCFCFVFAFFLNQSYFMAKIIFACKINKKKIQYLVNYFRDHLKGGWSLYPLVVSITTVSLQSVNIRNLSVTDV